MSSQVSILLALVFTLSRVSIARTQYLESPCPDIFTYQVDPNTKQIFGYVEIDNIQVGQTAKLNIDLSIATQLAQNNVGSITLVKSRESTFNDIVHGNPAQYRVNFPLQHILPSVLNIALNGQTICTGSRAQGRVITTINLEHTLTMVSLTIMDFKTKDLLILLTSWRTLYDPNNNQFNSDPRQDPHDRSLYIRNQQRQDLRSSKPCLPAQLPYELQFHLRSIIPAANLLVLASTNFRSTASA